MVRLQPLSPLLLQWLALLALLLAAGSLQARALTARIQRVDTAVASLQGVEVRLEWDKDADHGRLRLQARRVAGCG